MKKQLSNSFSTGGGGTRFEANIQGAFVTLTKHFQYTNQSIDIEKNPSVISKLYKVCCLKSLLIFLI
jgi:hypothetical protein